MKPRIYHALFLAFTALSLQGCISVPPLIQVEHKDEPADTNREVLRRLDNIDRRLDQLENKTATKP